MTSPGPDRRGAPRASNKGVWVGVPPAAGYTDDVTASLGRHLWVLRGPPAATI